MRAATSRRRAYVALVAGVATGLSACVQTGPQDYVTSQDGPEARALDRLWDPVFAIATIIFFGVMLGIAYILWKYRAKDGDEKPKQVHGNMALELGWTIAPALLLLFVGIGTVMGQVRLNRVPENALEVNVTGHQFWWEYEYPEFDIRTANELHIPVGRQVRLNLRSEEAPLGKKGVIHSYWIPKLAGKQDVVPGRVNHLNIEAEKPGTYAGQCVEFCGVSHANMRAKAVAHTPADFAEWVAGQQRSSRMPAPNTEAAEGAEVFSSMCIGCHAVRGLVDENGEEIATARVGPELTHLMSRKVFAGAIFDMNEKNLRKWLRDPPGEKPMNVEGGTGMPNLNLTEQQITALIAYLETLE